MQKGLNNHFLKTRSILLLKNIIYLLFFSVNNICFGQSTISGSARNFNPVPASPNAASFQKYGDLPVSYNTGTPGISIPIYTIELNGFSWPISLSYHASGFKSEDIASRVGLGWVLNSAGLISTKQSILGAGTGVDPRSWLNLYGNAIYPNVDLCVYENQEDIYLADDIVNGTKYISPNFYYINAGSISGRSIDNHMLPASDIKIDIQNLDASIVDESGNRYYFEDLGDNSISSSCQGITNLQANPTYYLSMIVTIKNDTLIFNYDDESYSYRQPDLHIIKSMEDGQLNACYSNYANEDYSCENVFYAHEKRLISIEASDGEKINFYYSSRDDLPGCSKVDSLHILYNDGVNENFIKSTIFNYSYFGQGTDPSGLQLRLDEVISSVNEVNTTENYKLEYNANPLPNKLSQSIIFNSPGTTNGFNYYNISKAGILEKLIYPTGGYTTFDYEVLQGEGILRIKEIADYSVSNFATGYRKFNYNDTPNSYIVYPFVDYETINYFGNPANGGPLSTVNEGNYCTYTPVEALILSCTRRVWKSTPNFNTILELMEASPRFSHITETYGVNGENGKAEYYYSGISANRQVNDVDYLFKSEYLTNKEIYEKRSDGSYKMIQQTLNDYAVPSCGLDFFGESSTDIEYRGWIKKIYKIRDEMQLTCPSNGSFCFPKKYMETNYRIASVPVYLKRTVEKSFSGEDSLVNTTDYYYLDSSHIKPTTIISNNSKGESIKTVFKYAHDFVGTPVYDYMWARNMLSPVEVIKYKNSTEIQRSKTSYRFWFGDLFIEPDTIKKSNNSQPYFNEALLQKYDSKDHLVEMVESNGIKRTFIWNYRNKYLVAALNNADSSSVAYTSFEADNNGNWTGIDPIHISTSQGVTGSKFYSRLNFSLSKGDLISTKKYIITYWSDSGPYSVSGTMSGYPKFIKKVKVGTTYWDLYEHKVSGITSVSVMGSGGIDEVRLYPEGSMMTTFTYKPLVGISSQCDANNQLSYFEYDGFGRLSFVRDENYNILKKYCYNFAGQPEDCSANKNPLWVPTGITRCKPCPTNNSYISNIQEHQEWDDNQYSTGYHTDIRWIEDGISTNCVPQPDWQTISSTCQLDAQSQNTGNQIQTQQDMNPCSASYNSTRQVTVNNASACPLPCSTSNCFGPDHKCVNGNCEQGLLICTSSVKQKVLVDGFYVWKWLCTFQYCFTDGSASTPFQEYHGTSCSVTSFCLY